MLGVSEEKEEDHGERKFLEACFSLINVQNTITLKCCVTRALVRAHALLTLIVYCLCSAGIRLVNAVANKYVRNVCGLFI